MESGITLTLHGVQLGISVAVLGILLNQHKVWIRVKDRVNTLWQDYCDHKKVPFIPLDNGK